MQGKIIKGIAGFYYVHAEDGAYLYEQINGNYQKLGDYAVTFEKAE